MFFSISELPDNPLFMLAWPLGLTLLSVIVWYFGYRVEENGGNAPWKWVAFAILAVALAIGISGLKLVFSGDYGLIGDSLGRKYRYCLYGAGAVPVIGLIAMAGLWYFQRINNAQRF